MFRIRPPILGALTFLAIPFQTVWAQRTPDERAAAAVARGDLQQARAIYDSLLVAQPADRSARVARGHVLSWLGKHDAALADFAAVLQTDSADLSAWLGTGYAASWSRQWDDAKAAFHQAAILAPDAAEPGKGLAYTALWRGDHALARERFSALASRYPDDPEIAAALGSVELADGHRGSARAAYARALLLDPQRRDAREGLEASHYLPAALEITVWGGYTYFADQALADQDRLALRAAQIAAQPTSRLRLWAAYDDGLALDNAAIVAAGSHVPWITTGGYVSWARALGTKVEGGWRDLGGDVTQWTASLEQVAVLGSGVSFKASGWAGFRSDSRTEWLAGAGVGVPVTSRLRVELMGFTSGNGLPDEDGFRGVLSGRYRFPTGLELGAGIAAGRTALDASRTGTLAEGYATASIPVLGQRLLLQARHQAVENGTDFTALTAGFTLGLLER
ncbi:MAG: hypothetical protein OEY20_09495 [Gemmatimonadota bacterium]|nr:hypothetical protein [Gemmatimonadota bacterium]